VASEQNDTFKSYGIYGVTIAEVEIDVLTGQHIIRRVDLIEDAGVSLNPELDVGQVEGAFVMGIGDWTSEDLVYDPKTGVLTNDRTWVFSNFNKTNIAKMQLRFTEIALEIHN